MIRNSGFFPTFGTGAPGATVPKNQPYFDTATNPMVQYVWVNSVTGWKTAGDRQDFDATTLQGVTVSNAAPADGNVLTYHTSGTQWEPA